tara:strand:+ start:606 stop:1577 length:972 start_codon:yes stop_codon:yes gene_type:complete
MKVIHLVLSEDFAGIEQHVDELLANNLDVKPILICNETIADNFNDKINIYKLKNIGRRSFIGKHRLNKLLTKLSPDIVHTHGSKTTTIISSINKKNYKHIATVHGIKKNKRTYEKADFVIGVSKNAVDGINNNTRIVTNWWNPKLSNLPVSKKKYALAIGRLEKIKGFDYLIESWKNINTELIIIGSGKEKKSLLRLINQKNLSNKIKIIDGMKSDDLREFYKNASVLIISSRDEGGPRVALEALYLQIPVLSTNVGHMDLIFPNELLAEKNNQTALQKLLESHVDRIDWLNQSAIFDFVRNEFSIDKKISEINEVYDLVLVN